MLTQCVVMCRMSDHRDIYMFICVYNMVTKHYLLFCFPISSTFPVFYFLFTYNMNFTFITPSTYLSQANQDDFTHTDVGRTAAKVFDIYTTFLDAARELHSMSDEDAITHLNATHRSEKEESKALSLLGATQHVPKTLRRVAATMTVEVVEACQACDDICTPSEWVKLFEAPLDIVLDSETVWPIEPPLKH